MASDTIRFILHPDIYVDINGCKSGQLGTVSFRTLSWLPLFFLYTSTVYLTPLMRNFVYYLQMI